MNFRLSVDENDQEEFAYDHDQEEIVASCLLFEDDPLSKSKLRGIPTPIGVKTTFLSPDIALGKEVHWRIEQYDEDFEIDKENNSHHNVQDSSDNNAIATATSISKKMSKQGIKTLFASPDLQIGKEVHWRIEDYDKPAAPATSEASSNNNNTDSSTRRKSLIPKRANNSNSKSSAKPMFKFDWMEAQSNGDLKTTTTKKMNYWLAKSGVPLR